MESVIVWVNNEKNAHLSFALDDHKAQGAEPSLNSSLN